MDKNNKGWGGKRINIKILRELTEKGVPFPACTFKNYCAIPQSCVGEK